MNMISQLRQRVKKEGKAEITLEEFNQLQGEWITRTKMEKDELPASLVEQWVSCCLTCSHWDGDKELQLKKIEEYGDIVMDADRGWPEDGYCGVMYKWGNIEINGDATATVLMEANFGCIYHSERKNN